MPYRDMLLEQRARCIAERFCERTVGELEPLSRERIREVIQGIIAELEEERKRESEA
jgi:hypothetical protein